MKPRAGTDDPIFIAFGEGTVMGKYEFVYQGHVNKLEEILRYWGFDVPRQRA